MLTYDFGSGRVPAKRHPKGGGWVANTAMVDPSAYIGEHVTVGDYATVGRDANLRGFMVIRDCVQIYPTVELLGRGSLNKDLIVTSSPVVIRDTHLGEYFLGVNPAGTTMLCTRIGAFTLDDVETYWPLASRIGRRMQAIIQALKHLTILLPNS